MSSITKCLNTSTICRKVARCAKKLCAVLIEADIFNKAVQGNIPKPLRNLYTKFDVNTLRLCGEMAWVEEHLHTFGNSDIATHGDVDKVMVLLKIDQLIGRAACKSRWPRPLLIERENLHLGFYFAGLIFVVCNGRLA